MSPEPDTETGTAESAGQGKEPREKGRWKRYSLRVLVLFVSWWIISAVFTMVPSPLAAAKGLLHLFKRVTDSLYFAANEESLKQSAQKVRESASESVNGAEKESVLNRMPTREKSRYQRYDSAMRAELKSLSPAPPVRGKVINILAIGSDARLGSSDLHADAIHLVTVSPDSGVMEIMSIPRDTYCDLGYPDTTSYNHAANARALGLPSFLNKIEEISGRGRIPYYIEVGFSQVMGILELLGYKDPSQTLKFLRTRKTLRGGDIQRSHNQAQFIRQAVMQKFDLLTGASGDLLLSAGLRFVATNLTKEFCVGLLYGLKEKGFPGQRTDAIRLRMLPIYRMRLAEMLPDSTTVAATLQHADVVLAEEMSGSKLDVARLLRSRIRKSIADSSRPARIVGNLSRYFTQRAWMQIPVRKERVDLRDSLFLILGRAYQKMGDDHKVREILEVRDAENLLYEKMVEQ